MANDPSSFAWRIPWTEKLVSYSPWDGKELDMIVTNNHTPKWRKMLMFAHVCQYWKQYTSKCLHWSLNYLSKQSSLIICTGSYSISFISVQILSPVRFVTPWIAAHLVSLSITNSWSLLKLMSIESVMPYNHLVLCHPLLLPPSIFPSKRVFSNESALCIRWPKHWSFSINISPSN